MEATTRVTAMQVRFDRFLLQRPVASDSRSQTWEAFDEASGRVVCLQLVPDHDPRFAEVVAEAAVAKDVDDPRLIRINDVVCAEGQVGIVTEWVAGRPWNTLLSAGVHYGEAVIVAYEVAAALKNAHAVGVTHGRLRPSSVIISPDGGVRLRGLGVDAALYGATLPYDEELADLHGLGCLLFAGFTAKWPSVNPAALMVDGLPVVHRHHGRFPMAIDLDDRVPRRLSDLADRCMSAGLRRRGAMRDMDAAVDALARAVRKETGQSADSVLRRRDRLVVARAGRYVAAAAALGLVVFGGYRFVSADPHVDESTLAAVAPNTPAPTEEEPAEAAPAEAPAPAPSQPLPIAGSQDFDPQGNEEENPHLVPFATDGNLDTAWMTVRYAVPSLKPKTGVGLLLDLGESRQITSVPLDLMPGGTDVELRVAGSKGASADNYTVVASATNAADHIILAPAAPVDARYVLIWFTKVPQTDAGIKSGIREVQVHG